MRRFYLADLSLASPDRLELPADIRRHLTTVLRQSEGDQFELFNGQGTLALCALDADGESARVLDIKQLEPPHFKIELIQGLAKGEKLDLVLQKGTELGLQNFILTSSERSVVKLADHKKEARLKRWQKIVHEACRQSGQPFTPGVSLSPNFATSLTQAQGDLKLMLWEEGQTSLPALLPEIAPSSISILVGPEGGFSQQEAEQAESAGFKTLRLGPRILRTETAGLAILSILQYIYGDLSSEVSSFSSSTNAKESS